MADSSPGGRRLSGLTATILLVGLLGLLFAVVVFRDVSLILPPLVVLGLAGLRFLRGI
jgi:hypothetical protein